MYRAVHLYCDDRGAAGRLWDGLRRGYALRQRDRVSQQAATTQRRLFKTTLPAHTLQRTMCHSKSLLRSHVSAIDIRNPTQPH